ncbi:4437_t:CDS:2, partial [Dentiscutata erythropus]
MDTNEESSRKRNANSVESKNSSELEKYVTNIGNIISYEENQISDDETLLNISDYSTTTTLLINEVINLDEENSESSIAEPFQAILLKDLDYDPCNVLNGFLECEKQNNCIFNLL